MKNLGNRCQYADICPVFKGEEKVSETPLSIYRNVFCNRGVKGWKNCKKYDEYEYKNTKEG